MSSCLDGLLLDTLVLHRPDLRQHATWRGCHRERRRFGVGESNLSIGSSGSQTAVPPDLWMPASPTVIGSPHVTHSDNVEPVRAAAVLIDELIGGACCERVGGDRNPPTLRERSRTSRLHAKLQASYSSGRELRIPTALPCVPYAVRSAERAGVVREVLRRAGLRLA